MSDTAYTTLMLVVCFAGGMMASVLLYIGWVMFGFDRMVKRWNREHDYGPQPPQKQEGSEE